MPMLYRVYLDRMRSSIFDMAMVSAEVELALKMSHEESYHPRGNFRGQHSFSPMAFTFYDEPQV